MHVIIAQTGHFSDSPRNSSHSSLSEEWDRAGQMNDRVLLIVFPLEQSVAISVCLELFGFFSYSEFTNKVDIYKIEFMVLC